MTSRAARCVQLWLLAELARLERLQHLLEKFRQKSALHAQWCVPRVSALATTDWRTFKLPELKACFSSLLFSSPIFSSPLPSASPSPEPPFALDQCICKFRTALHCTAPRRAELSSRRLALVAHCSLFNGRYSYASCASVSLSFVLALFLFYCIPIPSFRIGCARAP